jgi:hypothetical protein
MMPKLWLRCVVTILLMLALHGCAMQSTAESNRLALPAELAESSGLVCDGEQFVSFNDSGGEAVLYRFDAAGHIQQQLQLAVNNIDWEAIASDGHFLYLADTGNNAGKRSNLLIHKVPLDWSSLPQPYVPVTLQINLPGGAELKNHQHDLDFEALVYFKQSLWLFSKSWASGKPKVYRLNPASPQQQLGQAMELPSPGFLVTDASVAPGSSGWWLVGYSNPFTAVWAYLTGAGFEAKLARYDADFQLLAVTTLATQGQVEGLCIDQQQQIWISEEAGKQSPALLMKTGISSAGIMEKIRTDALKTQ